MYMANAEILRLGPNTTYIPLAHVGVFVSGVMQIFKICVRDNANFSNFRYQHVGIPKHKFHVGGLSQRMDPMPMFLPCSGI